MSTNPPPIQQPRPRTRQPRVDWFRVMVGLENTGRLSERAIAALLDMSQGWVKHVKNSPGAEPRFDDGCALLDLWCEVMDKPMSDVPREQSGVYR